MPSPEVARALEKSTGEGEWESGLPAAANATPATVEISAGGRYVALTLGGAKSQ